LDTLRRDAKYIIKFIVDNSLPLLSVFTPSDQVVLADRLGFS
jgi:hypothetical protein